MDKFEIHVNTDSGWRIFSSENVSFREEDFYICCSIMDVPEEITEDYLKTKSDKICNNLKKYNLKEIFDIPEETRFKCIHKVSYLKNVNYICVADVFHNEFYTMCTDQYCANHPSYFTSKRKNRFNAGNLYILKQFMQNNTLYICDARNFSLGLWHNGKMYYIRSKFGDSYIDTENHWDDGKENCGTCKPIRAFSSKLSERITDDSLFDCRNWRAQIVLHDILSCANSIFENV